MDLDSHIGRCEIRRDIADGDRMALLAATLDHAMPPWRPDVLPPLGHWLCFRPDASTESLGTDGHPARTRDGLIPADAPERRMWAGSRVTFVRDVTLNTGLTCTTTLKACALKSGRSGESLFVTLHHEIADDRGVAILEEQDIVYRPQFMPGQVIERATGEPVAPGQINRLVRPDAVTLFRYSALTFNAHRIHYDRDYAREQEGYPGLVVQGPLTATLLLDHVLRSYPQERVARFDFRAHAPAFDGEPMNLMLDREAEAIHLRAAGPAGVVVTATAILA